MPTLAIGLGVLVVPIVATVTVKSGESLAVCCSLAAGLTVLLANCTALRRTTLIGPWWWTLAALVCWCGTELVSVFSLVGGGSIEPLRLAAIALSFCPIVAVLGAKRPQSVAWSFVVLSLWAIVALPAAENFFLHPGQKVSMGDARAWFMWILILLGPINYVPTRFAVPSMVFAAGQIVALSPFLALIQRPLTREPAVVGLMIVASALVAAWLFSRRPKRGANPYDHLWLDFRDLFGLLWGLRVQERINAISQQDNWSLELTWNGFRRPNSGDALAEIDSSIEPALRTSFKGLLRRFVSNEWIDSRFSLRESTPFRGAKGD